MDGTGRAGGDEAEGGQGRLAGGERGQGFGGDEEWQEGCEDQGGIHC